VSACIGDATMRRSSGTVHQCKHTRNEGKPTTDSNPSLCFRFGLQQAEHLLRNLNIAALSERPRHFVIFMRDEITI
jgi:hypothetical protein